MDAAVDLGLHRQRNVDALFLEPVVERRAIMASLRRAERFLDRGFERVERGAARLALIRREAAERL